MQYHAYELAHACIFPMRIGTRNLRDFINYPFNPLSMTPWGQTVSAACDVFEGITRRYDKPEFDIDETEVDGRTVTDAESVVLEKPFCDLLHFKRGVSRARAKSDPKVLIIAPMSGHYATLLRGTVAAMLPGHEVYITDWRDARMVPLAAGDFDLDDFIDYVIEFTRFLGPDIHIVAVCQPSVPALAATAVMAAAQDPAAPASLVMMGGPIDTRRNPTQVNELAQSRDLAWFEDKVISTVPFPHPGWMRRVYPGFVQLSGFMTMNLDRHVDAHIGHFYDLVKGDEDSVEQHRKFYDEYLAVMDLPAAFYLQTVETVFQRHALPDGFLTHRGEVVDCAAIEKTAIMTVEGELDDICGLGQTEAAHDLCPNAPLKSHYVQEGVGHYGVFNGRRWRTEIQPRVAEMIGRVDAKRRG